MPPPATPTQSSRARSDVASPEATQEPLPVPTSPSSPAEEPREEPRSVEDPRARELLQDLLSMVRQAVGMGYKVEHFGDKLADKHKHFEMAERWARMDLPQDWLSAFIRWKVYAGFQDLMGELSQEHTKALLGFLDAEVGGLRAHWTNSNSYLEGSMSAFAEMKDAHIRLPEEDRPFLHDSVSQTRLDIFLISMSLIEFGLDNPANMRAWSEATEDKMPGGDWPSDLARLRSLPAVEVDDFGRAKQ